MIDMSNSGFDREQAEYNRNNRIYHPEYAPGQTPISDMNTPINNGFMDGSPDQMDSVFSSNPASFGLPQQQPQDIPTNNSFGQQTQAQQSNPEDVFFDSVKKGAKGSFNIIKDITSSMKELNARWYSEWGRINLITGGIVGVSGIILKLFGLESGLKIGIGGLLTSAIGVITWFTLTDSARTCKSKYKTDGIKPAPPKVETSTYTVPSFEVSQASFDDFDTEEDNDFFSDDVSEELGDDDEFANFVPTAEVSDGMSKEEALNSMPDIPRGMYERNYLWEMFTKVLPTMKPDFSEMKEVEDYEDEFLYWDEKLNEAHKISGGKEEDPPVLTKLQKNLFTIVLTCDRPVGFKTEQVGKELASLYAYQNGVFKEGVFSKVDTVGKSAIITIFNGDGAMISLKDMMLQEKDWICNSKVVMPVVFGIDQLGKVIKEDLKKLESIIVTGMPRSGKSWLVQSIITQMCAFVPPTELNLYICDPKEGISDFKSFVLPHVKKFVSDDNKIVDTLRNLVKIEAPRRKKIIGDANFVNIWDYKEKYPDTKLPIIYVIIDEIVTLASRMDKEVFDEFRMLLRELISQLPALGIRAMLIPHVLNNDIIEKKTSDIVMCKISVCGDAGHIEKATGSKPKDFPYVLANKGDMAVKLAGVPNTLYVHAPALTDSNVKNSELFEYLQRVWNKLEPEEKTQEEKPKEYSQITVGNDTDTYYDPLEDEDLGLF